MSPGYPIGVVIAALGGMVYPRLGFGMLAFVTVADMLIARYFGLKY